jgi:hypothetical protein
MVGISTTGFRVLVFFTLVGMIEEFDLTTCFRVVVTGFKEKEKKLYCALHPADSAIPINQSFSKKEEGVVEEEGVHLMLGIGRRAREAGTWGE